MAKGRCRKFTVFDALLLIAAIAVGLAWMRNFQDAEAGGESYPEDSPDRPISLLWYRVEVARWWGWSLSYVVAVVSIALLFLRLRGTSRNRLRTAARQPGVVAGGAALLTVTLDLLHSAIEVAAGVASGGHDGNPRQFTYLLVSNDNAAIAIAASWAWLALGGRWHRERGWLDNLGVVLGLFWLGLYGLSWLVEIRRLFG